MTSSNATRIEHGQDARVTVMLHRDTGFQPVLASHKIRGVVMPIKFEIYRNGERAAQYTPVAAMAMGPESVPIPGEIVFRDGLLIAEKQDEHAAGVALLWDCGDVGSY